MIDVREHLLHPWQLEELLQNGRRKVESLLSDPRTSVMPQLIVETLDVPSLESGKMLFLLDVDFGSADAKRLAFQSTARALVEAQRVPLAATFISEAWVSHEKQGEPRRFAKPEDDPERREAIVIAVQSIDRQQSALVDRMYLERNPQNVLLSGPWEESKPTTVRHNLLILFFQSFTQALVERRNHVAR